VTALVAIRHDALVVADAIAHVAAPSAGAIDVFLGVVRDHSEGRAVSRLEYTAYESMALAEMRRIADEIVQRWPGARLAAIHRLGALVVGDLAIVCAASAPHRAEAFDACRALIEAIKARVPIWKREHGPDGAAWVGWVDARCADPSHAHGPGHGHGHDHGAHGH
jgi:molybdopterin synthase catalytic subunit